MNLSVNINIYYTMYIYIISKYFITYCLKALAKTFFWGGRQSPSKTPPPI